MTEAAKPFRIMILKPYRAGRATAAAAATIKHILSIVPLPHKIEIEEQHSKCCTDLEIAITALNRIHLEPTSLSNAVKIAGETIAKLKNIRNQYSTFVDEKF